MAANVYISVSGPALSFLLYENVKNLSDQEGFLLGEIVSHVTDTISDSQMRGEKMETLISVNSLMPIPNSLTFYNGIGKINHKKLKEFLKEKEKEVIGWYSFKRNSVLSPHLREKLLHKELCSSLSHMSSEHFTMCLLNTSVSTPGSTHMFNHKFIRYRHRMFEPLPVQIHNLGEAPQSEYKLVPSTACLSDSFNNIISSLRTSHEGSDDFLVCNIQRALQEHLRHLISDVEQSERKIAELQREVDSLRLQSGPISNELLLPHILKEEVPTTVSNNSTPSSIKLEPSETDDVINVPAKVTKNQDSHNTSESNHKTSSGKEEVIDHNSTSDAFAFVTEMKIQMSLPQNAESVVDNSSITSNKRQSERVRGGGRGGGRGIRRISQTKPHEASDSPAIHRHATQSQIPDSTSPRPVRNVSQNINNVNTKPRAGYAQAVKRAGVNSGSALNKSQTAPANSSPANSDSQNY